MKILLILYSYRATLPSSAIKSLDQTPILFTMNIGLFISNENRRNLISEDLEALSGASDVFKVRVTNVEINPTEIANVKTPAKLEALIMKHHPVKPGDLLIIEWKSHQDEILVTSDRTIFISDRVGEKDISHMNSFSKRFSPK